MEQTNPSESSGGRAVLRPRTLAIAGVAVFSVGAGAMLLASPGQSQQPSEPPPVPVAAVAAERRDVPHLVEVVGTVEPLAEVVIRTQVDGILTRVAFEEGDMVQKGQLLAVIDDRALSAALAAAQAQLARDRAQLRAAELDLARYQALLERNAISRQTVDQQLAEVDQLRATVRLDEANVDTARVNLSYTRITSPITGRLGIRRVDAGNLVRTSDPDGLVSVAQVDPISVVFPVPQAMLGELRDSAAGGDGGSSVELFDRTSGQALATGRITAFDNRIGDGSGTANVRARFANGSERLAPGAFVSVRVRTGITPGAVVLPAVAVRPGLEGHFVYKVREGTVERQPVKVGYANDSVAVVERGVAPGEMVVTDGYSRLTDGARVALRRPAATATAGVSVNTAAGRGAR